MNEQLVTRSVSVNTGLDLTKKYDLSAVKITIKPYESKILTAEQIDDRFDRYTVIRNLQKGANSSVYLVKNIYTCQRFAVKKVKKDSESPQVEAQIHLSLNHPRIVKTYEYCEHSTHQFYVMEYLSRQDLREYMIKIGLPPTHKKSKWFSQTVEALKYCYNRGVMHRDVKSENLMLNRDENIKLIDFGFATQDLISTKICGTLECMAPEIILGLEYNYKVDVWSLGILLFELFFGRTPFRTNSRTPQHQIIRNITDHPCIIPEGNNPPTELILSLLNKEPDLRPTYTNLQNHNFSQQYKNNFV